MLQKPNIVRSELSIEIAKDRERLATFANVDFQRARFWCLCASISINYPRRLGAVENSELIFDKRVSRKIHSAYREVWKIHHRNDKVPEPPVWGKKNEYAVLYTDPLMNRIGATVMWERQVATLLEIVHRRQELMAEYRELANLDGLTRWYNKHLNALNWEADALQRIIKFQEAKRPTV